jgi:hypothetical protein
VLFCIASCHKISRSTATMTKGRNKGDLEATARELATETGLFNLSETEREGILAALGKDLNQQAPAEYAALKAAVLAEAPNTQPEVPDYDPAEIRVATAVSGLARAAGPLPLRQPAGGHGGGRNRPARVSGSNKVAVLPSEVTIREILAAFVPEP